MVSASVRGCTESLSVGRPAVVGCSDSVGGDSVVDESRFVVECTPGGVLEAITAPPVRRAVPFP